ncbi:MAG: nucleotidyltransferase family protein [Usitatibacter sp.]
MSPDIRGLLLCGGASKRFGSDKLVATIGTREGAPAPIVEHAARHLLEGAGNVLAVIPPGAALLRAILEPLGCKVLESERTAQGVGASLAAAVQGSPGADGWIVALGDMPFIQPRTIAAVRAQLAAGALIAAPVDRGTRERGHPVGFAKALWPELVALDGDEGARSIVARHRQALSEVAVDDRGIFLDIDTPRDLE